MLLILLLPVHAINFHHVGFNSVNFLHGVSKPHNLLIGLRLEGALRHRCEFLLPLHHDYVYTIISFSFVAPSTPSTPESFGYNHRTCRGTASWRIEDYYSSWGRMNNLLGTTPPPAISIDPCCCWHHHHLPDPQNFSQQQASRNVYSK